MLLNCKFCGGELEITHGVSVTTCKYCHTAQTLPKTADEGQQGLFNRANSLRRRCDFSKAEAAFEKIIEADGCESEAYWGLVLCKYGIEYVEDPATGKMIPTCHRASYDSVIADEDYKSAIEHADDERKALYEEQAKEIDRIQKEIIALAQKEETYDVFICYKETDENGKKTRDSILANELYYQYTQEGFKVFYAAITLEGKLGKDYEPIIFAALNSAKVMLVVGSKPEYFNAVWVKNEWSRYLKIMKKDHKKLLIPCYRDMDAYDLPDEFAHLQAQDMSKFGSAINILNGIHRVMDSFKKKPDVIVEKTETLIKEKKTMSLKKNSKRKKRTTLNSIIKKTKTSITNFFEFIGEAICNLGEFLSGAIDLIPLLIIALGSIVSLTLLTIFLTKINWSLTPQLQNKIGLYAGIILFTIFSFIIYKLDDEIICDYYISSSIILGTFILLNFIWRIIFYINYNIIFLYITATEIISGIILSIITFNDFEEEWGWIQITEIFIAIILLLITLVWM